MKKLSIPLVALALTLATGCDRKMDPASSVPQPPRQGAVPVNVQALVGDQAVTLTWSVTDDSDIRRFRVYVSENDTLNYVLRDSSATGSITIADLQVNRRYYFKVAALMNSGVEWYRSAPVTAYLARLAVSIENGAEYTKSRVVDLYVNVPDGATDIMLSERSDFLGAVWQEFDNPAGFTLSEGDGTKTVYARVQFADGSESGLTMSDAIILDTYCHIEEVSFTPAGHDFVGGEAILFVVDAEETGGQAGVSFGDYGSISLNDRGADGDAVADDGVYSYRYIVPANIRADEEVVSGQFTDAAGNVAGAGTAAQRLTIRDDVAPEPVMLVAAIASDTTVVELNWSASLDEDFLWYRIYKDASGGDVSTNDELVAAIAGRSTTAYSYHVRSAEHKQTVRFAIWVYDRFGGVSVASNTVSVNVP